MMDPNEATHAADESDAVAAHEADRPPTEQEELDAEEVAAQVDLGEVAGHYEEMSELGASVRGEGQI